jgi:hypothetical protein
MRFGLRLLLRLLPGLGAFLAGLVLVGVSNAPAPIAAAKPHRQTLHYTANGNFNRNGRYRPRVDGFNLADVGSKAVLDSLPPGVKGLVYIDMCTGNTPAFRSLVRPFKGDPRAFGFYLMDEPDPTGIHKPLCAPASLKAESNYVHQHLRGLKTFIILMNMGSTAKPSYKGQTYTPANSHINLFGLDPYPCHSKIDGCRFRYISRGVAAAEAAGIPKRRIVPVYQAFGGGSYLDDMAGHYLLPTRKQARKAFTVWASVVPSPVFDYAYSWGVQEGDQALSNSPALQRAFEVHNRS